MARHWSDNLSRCSAAKAFGPDFAFPMVSAPDAVAYDLRGLRKRTGDATASSYGSRFYACVNTAANPDGAISWLNVYNPASGLYRRDWESKRHRAAGSMIGNCANARTLAVRKALEMARQAGCDFAVITHET